MKGSNASPLRPAPDNGASALSFAAEIVASPSNDTVFGCKILEDMPDTDYSLGIAISEALADAATRDDTK